MTYQHTTQYPRPKRKRRVWPWLVGIAIGVVLLIGCIGAMTAFEDAAQDETAAAAPATTPAKAAKKGPPPPAAKTIGGDDLVHVGEDVPAGVYRATEPVDGLCYWLKSKDAEGTQIIDNDIPAGGRPQVTLKAGQWFKSQGCPQWVAK